MACTRAIENDTDYESAYYNRACYRAILDMPKNEILQDLKSSILLRSMNAELAREDNDFHKLWNDEDFLKVTAEV